MALFLFTEAILNDKPINVFNHGKMIRDFTYVDDIARGTILASKQLGYEIINLGGGNNPYTLLQMIDLMEKYSGKKAKLKLSEKVAADMDVTWADISKAKKLLGWEPKVGFEEGLRRLVEWHQKGLL